MIVKIYQHGKIINLMETSSIIKNFHKILTTQSMIRTQAQKILIKMKRNKYLIILEPIKMQEEIKCFAPLKVIIKLNQTKKNPLRI